MSDASCLPHFSISVKLETSEHYGHFWRHQCEIGGKGDNSMSVDLGNSQGQSAPLAVHIEIARKGKEWGWASSRGRRGSIQSDAREKVLRPLAGADWNVESSRLEMEGQT